ncbi:hypothetical protein AAWM_02985 [Aspergillus awamori]|nr:hypothetical protein AAWM_02985 [Aspergillus awamori]
MQQAIGLPDIHRLVDCLSEANRRELPRTRDVVCAIVQDQDILQMEPNPIEYCIHCTTTSKLTIVHDWQRALTDTDLRSIRASILPVMHDVAPMPEAWSWSEQDWETPALYLQALRSPGKTNRAALASSLADFKYQDRHAVEMNFNDRSSAVWASGHLCVCSLLPIAQGHMLTLNEEQIPKPPPQMTMQASVQDTIWGKRIGVGMGKAKMCATRGTAPLVNARLKYTDIL